MLDGITSDDSEAPTIGLVPVGVTWEDVQNHIKIVHAPLLVPLGDGGQYRGVYWDSTMLAATDDLGSDQEQALGEFRDFLRERGEA
jgi:hypothetical protein